MKNVVELHQQKERELAEELLGKGYKVLVEPALDQLPFELNGYRPDIVAEKDGKGIVIEVKSSARRISVDKFQTISNEVAKHEGWRFVLVTLDDEGASIFTNTLEQLPDSTEINQRIEKVEHLVELEMYDAGLLYLWSTLEVSLRVSAIKANLPVERFSALKIIDHLYSNGELSIYQYDFLKEAAKLRNKVAHGSVSSVSKEQVLEALEVLKSINASSVG
ncbi:TPA: hypothetical protein ACMDP0_000504 [Vibrio parahaemolyticus]